MSRFVPWLLRTWPMPLTTAATAIASTAATISASPRRGRRPRNGSACMAPGTVARLKMGGDDSGSERGRWRRHRAGAHPRTAARPAGVGDRDPLLHRRERGHGGRRGAHDLARLGLRLVDARAAVALARRHEALVPRARVRL